MSYQRPVLYTAQFEIFIRLKHLPFTVIIPLLYLAYYTQTMTMKHCQYGLY